MLTLGPFDIETLVRHDPHRSVWRGVHRASGHPVAIEVAPPGDDEALLHGVRALARMRHPAVQHIHKHGRVPLDLRPDRPDQRAALAPGGVWRAIDWLDPLPAPTSWPALRATLLTVLDGLAHAHAHRVLHLALGPHALVAGPEGAVIVDFDRAAIDGERPDPPEPSLDPAASAPSALGPWLDLGALGALARGWLHPASTEQGPVIEPPPGVDAWLDRLTADDPTTRFRFAADAAHALRACDGVDDPQASTLREPTALTGQPTRHDEPYAATLTLAGDVVELGRPAPGPPLPFRCPPSSAPPLLADTGRALAALRLEPTIGRLDARARLWSELRAAVGGHTRLVLLDGPAGAGKSHLAGHLARLAHAHGAAEYVIAKHPIDPLPGSGLGPALARRIGGDDRRVALTGGALDDGDHALVARAAAADPRLIDRAAIDACIGLIGALCAARALVVVIDDAQWAPGALALTRTLLDHHRDLPLLLIVCARDEPDPRAVSARELVESLAVHPRVSRVAVPPLDDDTLIALVRSRVALPPSRVGALVDSAHGRPRRVIDALRALGEAGPTLPAPEATGDPLADADHRPTGSTNPLPPIDPVTAPRPPRRRTTDPLDLAPTLGPYVLLGRAGRGGAGEVWKALHRAEGVSLAIKFITARGDDRSHRHLEHELRAVARMDHPHIIRVHDHGRTPTEIAERCGFAVGAPYIVMDWHDGGTLRGRLGAVDWPELRRLLVVLLDALAHAHARDVVHRDLKPDNVLIGESGPVLTDFGVALALDLEGRDDGARGTPGYMSPEQIRSQSHQIGPWTDLYALGCLTHALVTGRPPFGSSPPLTVMQRHLEQDPPPLGAMPAALDAWVSRLLDKDPARRFRFAAHARDALPPLGAPSSPPDTLEDPPEPTPPRRLGGITRPLIRLRQPEPSGRDDERAGLWRALTDALDGPETTTVVIEGPSGSGKTALVRWLARRAHSLGRATALRARHQRHPGPIDGLAPMFARALRTDGLDDRAAIARVRAALELDRHDPLAAAILAAARPQWTAHSSNEFVTLGSRHEHFATLGHALARLCALTPRVLHVDDAQWATEAIDFVRHLRDRHPELPLLTVLTVSPDQLDARSDAALALRHLVDDPAVIRLALAPLGDDAIAEMVARLAPASPALVAEITHRAAGSPLLAELLLGRWLETGAITPGADGLRLRARPPSLAPAAHALWIARLDEIIPAAGPATWAALELAATLGVVVDRREWSALTAGGAPRLARSTLAVLCDAGLARDGATAWRFVHAMLRDALVERARLAGRLAAHHARCARALATLPDITPERLVRHHLAADDPAAALPAALDAARRARRRTDITATRRALFDAARALHRHPHPDPVVRVEIAARWALTDKSRGHLERARRHARRAQRLARRTGAPHAIAWAAYALGEATTQSDPPAADGHLARAYRAALAARRPELAARALEARGWALYNRGRLDQIDALLQLAPELVDALDDPLYEGNLIYLRAIVARARGDLDAAAHHLARARLLYRTAGTRHGLGSVRNEMGEIAYARGDYREALDHYLAFRRISDALAHRSALIADLNLGRAYDALGRHPDGERHRREALRLATRDGDPAMAAFARVCLLVDAARAGRLAEYDALLDALGLLRDGALVAVEAADAAERAADLIEGTDRARAARALELAHTQCTRLGDTERAARLTARVEALRR
ncbi:MAG: AAA family ATPase [bacterium]